MRRGEAPHHATPKGTRCPRPGIPPDQFPLPIGEAGLRVRGTKTETTPQRIAPSEVWF